jgi:hypothetical protein
MMGSCNKPDCLMENPDFVNKGIPDYAYLAEFKQLIEDNKEGSFRYWITDYTIKDEQEYIQIKIQGKTFCAIADMLVEEAEKLNQLRKVRGKSFQGAEITRLKWKIVESKKAFQFIYLDHEEIID